MMPCVDYLSFKAVSKTYKKELGGTSHLALNNLSFSLQAGSVKGLIGANGAGKSTCMRLLMDFIRPDTGQIMLFGEYAKCPSLRQRVGYLPEIATFPQNLSVQDMLRFAGRSCNMPIRFIAERSEELLKLLDLWDFRKKPLRSYSKGMQQRASFAIALLNDPELLILDEPMSGLDPLGRAMIINLINELKLQGKTILFCSHVLEDVDRLVDTVLVLHKGECLYDGILEQLYEDVNKGALVDAYLQLIQGGGRE